MIYDQKRIRNILNEYSREDPEHAWHMISKLNCYRFEKQIRLCASLIKKNGAVLDLGCGWGHTAAVLSMIRPDLKIIGIDKKKSRMWGKYKGFQCKFMIGDATNIKFKSGSFDAVISFGVMEHVDNDMKMLHEIYRILNLGGLNFVFNLPSKYSLNEFFARLLKIWHHDVLYTKKEVRSRFEENRFRVLRIKREFLIPSQINRINKRIGEFFDKYYKLIYRVDRILTKTPLGRLAQTYSIICRKEK